MRYAEQHEQIVEVCKTSLTLVEVEARLGTTTPNTGLRRYIKQNQIPMPIYEGRRAGCRLSQKSRKSLTETDLCVNSPTTTGAIKRYLIRTRQKEQKCERCGWCERRESDGKIPIHLHHKNGDSSDNRYGNLEFLCPNCHSLTDNYAGKNTRNPKRTKEAIARRLLYLAPKNICESCGRLGYGERYCSISCSHEATRKVVWPSKEQLADELTKLSWVAVGRKYGVSDNAVRKWARHYEINLEPR